jgi:hypothetical protein
VLLLLLKERAWPTYTLLLLLLLLLVMLLLLLLLHCQLPQPPLLALAEHLLATCVALAGPLLWAAAAAGV